MPEGAVEVDGEVDSERLAELVDAALEDRTLRQPAYTADLDRARLLEFAVANPPKLDAVGVDERARIERAKREAQFAHDELKEEEDKNRSRRRIAIVLIAELIVTLLGAAVFLGASGMWVWVAVLLLVGIPITMVGIGIVIDWPPSRLLIRSARLEGAISDAKEVCAQAEADLEKVLVDEAVKPDLRAFVNSQESGEYRITLTLTEQEGLAELEDPRYAIPTRAREQLDGFLDDMPGGSIGLAGPRGVGKTTLIRSVCPTAEGGTERKFGLVVAAPVNFDPREFLLYLFAETCRAIVGSRGIAELRKPDSVADMTSGPPLRALLPTAVLLLAIAGVAMIVGAALELPQLPQMVGGVLLIMAAVAGWRSRHLLARNYTYEGRRFAAFARSRVTGLPEALVQQAADRLSDIWYQQTFTTGWSGKLKAPIGEAGLQGSRELARQQMTLPDIVGEFRRLLAEIAEKRQVLIGIDELDKIESRDAAHKFMNEMKVLFGVENCFFLLSVSEDAMSAFERRGLPFRDVFDSSFDDVVNVGFLDLEESVALIQRRVIGMPRPFIALCHCVAGGLARDVIRVAREIVVSNPKGKTGWPVGEACRTIVATDTRAKIDASLVATRAMSGGPEVESLRSWLQRVRDTPVEPDSLFEVCALGHDDPLSYLDEDGLAGTVDGAVSPRALARELLTFLLYSATLLEFFDSNGSPAKYRDAYDSGRLDQLARARQALAVHPRVAWECLRDFRDDSSTPPFPVRMVART